VAAWWNEITINEECVKTVLTASVVSQCKKFLINSRHTTQKLRALFNYLNNFFVLARLFSIFQNENTQKLRQTSKEHGAKYNKNTYEEQQNILSSQCTVDLMRPARREK
jgi:exonuclease VII large subunit